MYIFIGWFMEQEIMAEKLKKYNSARFRTIIEKSGDEYVCAIPELCLITVAEDSATALSSIEHKKNDYFQKMLSYGLEEDFSLPMNFVQLQERSHFWNDLKFFLIKNIVLTMCLILLVSVSGFVAGYFFKQGVVFFEGRVTEKVGYVFNSTDQKQEERIDKFKEKIKSLKPYVKEIKKLFED